MSLNRSPPSKFMHSITALIFGRFLDVVNDQDFCRGSDSFQFQPKLFLNCGEETRRRIGVIAERTGLRCLIGRKTQVEVVPADESGMIDYRPV
jgi:hypothetical protein